MKVTTKVSLSKKIVLSFPLILASNSPRRKEIAEMAGFSFDVQVRETDEKFDPLLPLPEIPIYLAKKKAKLFEQEAKKNIVICADTIVTIDNEVINKPTDEADAKKMLQKLSGRKHTVYTGVCIKTPMEEISFVEATDVFFNELTDWEIDFYIETCHPLDKAGAYGIQDFIGMVGINRIEGSFYTVMGFPIHKIYAVLGKYFIIGL